MDGMGAEQLPLPAEQPEADDEIDIEGDDDVPLLHHEALQHEACLCRINLSLAFTQAVPQAASACSPMIEQCLAVDQHLTLAQELVQEPAEEPSEHTAATVEDELDPAALEQYHDEQYHEEYEVEPAEDVEAAAAAAVAEEDARTHEEVYEQVPVRHAASSLVRLRAGPGLSCTRWQTYVSFAPCTLMERRRCLRRREACHADRNHSTLRSMIPVVAHAQATDASVPPAPAELAPLEEWQRMQVPHEWLPSPTFWVRLSDTGGRAAVL